MKHRRKPSARDAALRLLRVRPRTAQELRHRLQRKGYSEGEIKEVLEDLKATGVLDEREFAESFTLGKMRNLYSRTWIGRALRQAGVPDDIVNTVLSEVYHEEEVLQGLVDHAQRIAQQVSDPEKAKRRVYAYILRRGHPPSVAYRVLKSVFG